MPPTPSSHEFRLVNKVLCNGSVYVSKYRSDKTGLQLSIADAKGPNVSGYVCFATEADNDDGLPHSVEHLIYMGSKGYPYKGLLDLVANRCLADGTNAWTQADHTCYTLTTAGAEGFLITLPMYLDHIFHPLLTDAQFLTEVHHVTGEGEDGGVVYCEMQDLESKMESMVDLKFNERMFPNGCGYRYQTGGRIPNLRSSCNIQKVRAYHEAFYHPQNCHIIIAGPIDDTKIFETLKTVEENLVKMKPIKMAIQRPWTSPIAPLIVKEINGMAVDMVVVRCPSDLGMTGMVSIGWRGPFAKERYKVIAVGVLLGYLADIAISPLEREFIQVLDPLCATINADVQEYYETRIKIDFCGVKVDKLKMIHPRLMATIRKIADDEEKLDMKRMQDLLRQYELKVLNEMETRPRHVISKTVIGDFLYGNSNDETVTRMDLSGMYKKLRIETKNFWLGLLREYLSQSRPHICVNGEPSRDLVKESTETEQKRVQAQKIHLGKDGMEDCGMKLENAMKENTKNKPPDALLERCIVNSLDGIRFLDVSSSTNRTSEEDSNFDFPLSSLPCTALLTDCNGTSFVELGVLLDSRPVLQNRKPFLYLWSHLIFESPIARDGATVPYETVIMELDRDLVNHGACYGVEGVFPRILSVKLKVDFERYKNAVGWARQLLHETQFDRNRIRNVALRIINMADDYKQDGHSVANFLLDALTFDAGSQPLLQNVLWQEVFLKTLLIRLEKEPNTVISDMYLLREEITRPNGMVVTIFCDAKKLKESGIKMQDVLSTELLPTRLKGCDAKDRAKIDGEEPNYVKPTESFGSGVIATVGACESCCVVQNSPCLVGYDDSDFPALLVLLQYLGQSEGPLRKEIRGRGLAYGVSIWYNADTGLIHFLLCRTSDPVLAYKESKRVIAEHLENKEYFEKAKIEAAKRSLMFEVIAKEATIKKSCDQVFLCYYRGVPLTYNRKLLGNILDVDVETMQEVGKKYVAGLFNFGLSNTAITCHPSKLDCVIEGYKKLGRDLKTVSLKDKWLFKY